MRKAVPDISGLEIDSYELYSCFVEIENLVQPNLPAYQERVARLGYRIAGFVGLPKSSRDRIYFAGLFHDIGLISTGEKIEWVDDALYNVHNHAFLGARLLSEIKLMQPISPVIKYHHIPYRFGIGMAHLVDPRKAITPQIRGAVKSITGQKNTVFVPELVEAFLELSEDRRFWAEVAGDFPSQTYKRPFFSVRRFTADDLVGLSRVVSHIIDFRSSFTANHSAGVAKTASTLASLAGLTREECQLMLISGYLHDIGKLAVDVSLLDKPAALTPEEFKTVKRHAFHTYRLLNMVKGFTEINSWASLHHEKLNGKGYPFGLKGKDIPLGARIMAVADVFTALTEDRPYRKGMSREEVTAVFVSMVQDGSLCPGVVDLLMENMELLHHVLTDSLKKAEIEYRRFKSMAL